MNSHSKSILICAGEASGDFHGSTLVRELLRQDVSCQIWGIGGNAMKNAGVNLLAHSSDLSVTGIFEVFFKLKNILKIFLKIIKEVKKNPPDLAILIDFPDFNLKLAKRLKKKNIPVIYYISPQVWAWRKRRVYAIQKWVTKMLVIFPFEKEFYQKFGVDVEFVGHPLMEEKENNFRRNGSCLQNTPLVLGASKSGVPLTSFTVALVPGSRKNEIHYLLDPMVDAAKIIHQKYSNAKFLLPLAPSLDFKKIQGKIEKVQVPIQITQEKFYETLEACDVAICCSGTASLEAAILGKPIVIIYRMNRISYFLGRLLIRNIRFFGMPNILLGEKVVPELLQEEVTGENIAKEIIRFLSEKNYRHETSKKLLSISKILGSKRASQEAAKLIFDVLKREKAREIPQNLSGFFSFFIFPPWEKIVYFLSTGRALLYHFRILKSNKVPAKVVSIGNISFGGTGKTPFTIYLAKYYQKQGKRVAILSRGYKRRNKKSLKVEPHMSVLDVGDEPYLMAQKLPTVPVYVGKNRYENAKRAIQENSSDVLLLDDGFQHWKLSRDKDIVLMDVTKPRTFLREPVSSLSRADVILLNRVNSISLEKKENIKNTLNKVSKTPLLEVNMKANKLIHVITQGTLPLEKLNSKKVMAFAGIGNPFSFKELLLHLKGDVVQFLPYRDHYFYEIKDIEYILNIYRNSHAEYIVTTEKDAVRLFSKQEYHLVLKQIPIFALEARLEITEEEYVFNHFLSV